MELTELLMHFDRGDTIGEDFAVIEQMRFYSREAQKITMELNTAVHEPEEIAEIFSRHDDRRRCARKSDQKD